MTLGSVAGAGLVGHTQRLHFGFAPFLLNEATAPEAEPGRNGVDVRARVAG